MRLELLRTSFSTADTSYPELSSGEGTLLVRFESASGESVCVEYREVAAFSWQENNGELLPGEPWDGACELFESSLLAAHPQGLTMHSLSKLRHLRFNFNECGRLEVLCSEFTQRA